MDHFWPRKPAQQYLGILVVRAVLFESPGELAWFRGGLCLWWFLRGLLVVSSWPLGRSWCQSEILYRIEQPLQGSETSCPCM